MQPNKEQYIRLVEMSGELIRLCYNTPESRKSLEEDFKQKYKNVCQLLKKEFTCDPDLKHYIKSIPSLWALYSLTFQIILLLIIHILIIANGLYWHIYTGAIFHGADTIYPLAGYVIGLILVIFFRNIGKPAMDRLIVDMQKINEIARRKVAADT
jgi:hypothetical protein